MRTRGDDGFTLIESLVALVIIIAVATMLYRGMSSGLRVVAAAAGSQSALEVAKSRLAGLGFDAPLEAGTLQGVEGGIVWQIVLRPYLPPDAADRLAKVRAFWATVTVTWRDQHGRAPRSLELTTLKMGPLQ